MRHFVELYTAQAMKTLKRPATVEEIVLNMKFGIVGELGEVFDLLKKSFFQGHELDIKKLEEEIGDTLWYVMIFDHLNGKKITDEMLTVAPVTKSAYDLIGSYPSDISDQLEVFSCVMSVVGMFDLDPISIMKENIEKLRKRYGESFSEERSIWRKK